MNEIIDPSMARQCDINITKNGRNGVRLTDPSSDHVALLDSLVGIAKTDEVISIEDIKRVRFEDT